jgi:hypothetical protein
MKYFTTFGTGPYKPSVERIIQEANAFNIFDHLLPFDSSIYDKEFANLSINTSPTRGNGYWLWKPYIIKIVLNLMNENDILLYCDSGCRLFPQCKTRLLEYFSILEKSNESILSFQLRYIEKEWSKQDLLDLFPGMENTNQLMATTFLIKKNTKSVKIINEWFSIGMMNNHHFIDDSPSKNNNNYFKDHRHDQSIFSLLRKKYGTIIINDEIDEVEAIFPIRAFRIKGNGIFIREPLHTIKNLQIIELLALKVNKLVLVCDINYFQVASKIRFSNTNIHFYKSNFKDIEKEYMLQNFEIMDIKYRLNEKGQELVVAEKAVTEILTDTLDKASNQNSLDKASNQNSLDKASNQNSLDKASNQNTLDKAFNWLLTNKSKHLYQNYLSQNKTFDKNKTSINFDENNCIHYKFDNMTLPPNTLYFDIQYENNLCITLETKKEKNYHGKLTDIYINEYDIIQGKKFRDYFDLLQFRYTNIIFCKPDFLGILNEAQNILKNKLTLITSSSDHTIDDTIVHHFNNKIRKWYGVNMTSSNTKCVQIPLGITSYDTRSDGLFIGYSNDITPIHKVLSDTQLLISIRNLHKPKLNLVYMNFDEKTNEERKSIYQLFINKKWVTHGTLNKNESGRKQFLEQCHEHFYVLCPRGNGIDTHRIWETLYVGSVPIVKFEKGLESFKDLPILFVDNFNSVTEEMLNEKKSYFYDTVWNLEKLFFNYWKMEITQSNKN